MTTSQKPGEGGARRGRRGPALDERTTAVIQAAFFEELAAVGYGRLSVDSIVKRAGVSKAAVYRRWPSKADMVAAMIAQVATGTVEMPNTGSLQGDLVAFLNATHDAMRHPMAARIIPAILSEAGRDDALAAMLRATVEAPRRAYAERMLCRAIERGELPADCDMDLSLDLMIGTLYFRALVRQQDLDRPAIQRLADSTIAAFAATSPSQPAT